MIELGVDFRVDPTQKNKWKSPISKLAMRGQKNYCSIFMTIVWILWM